MTRPAKSMKRLYRRGFLRSVVEIAAPSAGLVLISSGCEVLPIRTRPHVPRVGYMSIGPREPNARAHDAFRQGLTDLGYIDGETISIDWRFAVEGDDAGWPTIARELLALPVDVFVIFGSTPASKIVKQLTRTVPIVAVNVSKPVETGLVASLARPGSNLTAIPNSISTGPSTESKQVDLLREVVADLARLAVLVEIDNPALVANWNEHRATAESVDVQAVEVDLRSADDLEAAFQTPAVIQAQAFINDANPILLPVRTRLAELALRKKLPGISGTLSFAEAGLLMAYGVNRATLTRRAAEFVDKILKGANPADLPVEQPTVFDLLVNVKTLNALGLMIPPSVLPLVTEWIE